MGSKLAIEAVNLVAEAKADECLAKFMVEFKKNGGGDVTPAEKVMIREAYKFGFAEGCDYYGKSILERL